jgi:hypothetical protein
VDGGPEALSVRAHLGDLRPDDRQLHDQVNLPLALRDDAAVGRAVLVGQPALGVARVEELDVDLAVERADGAEPVDLVEEARHVGLGERPERLRDADGALRVEEAATRRQQGRGQQQRQPPQSHSL